MFNKMTFDGSISYKIVTIHFANMNEHRGFHVNIQVCDFKRQIRGSTDRLHEAEMESVFVSHISCEAERSVRVRGRYL